MPSWFFLQVKPPERFAIWCLRNEATKKICDHGNLDTTITENHKRGPSTSIIRSGTLLEGGPRPLAGVDSTPLAS